MRMQFCVPRNWSLDDLESFVNTWFPVQHYGWDFGCEWIVEKDPDGYLTRVPCPMYEHCDHIMLRIEIKGN
jgi:hypothetical protein